MSQNNFKKNGFKSLKNRKKNFKRCKLAGERMKEKMAEVNQQKLAFEYRDKSQEEREQLLRIERREHESELKQISRSKQ